MSELGRKVAVPNKRAIIGVTSINKLPIRRYLIGLSTALGDKRRVGLPIYSDHVGLLLYGTYKWHRPR